jgi:hypothetical protein
MAEAAYATGPALLGALRFFWWPRAFGGPALKSPENSRPQKIDPKRFLFVPCFSVSARGPKERKVPRKRYRPPNLKMEAPNDFLFLVLARSPKESKAPKAKPQTKKNARPQSLKRRGSKSRPANTKFFVPSLGKGLQKAIARPEIHRVQKISKFAANCYILKDR